MIYGNNILNEQTRNMLILDSEIDNFSKITESTYLLEFSFSDIIDKVLAFLKAIKDFIVGLVKKIKDAIVGFFNKGKNDSGSTSSGGSTSASKPVGIGTAKSQTKSEEETKAYVAEYYKLDVVYNKYEPMINKLFGELKVDDIKKEFEKEMDEYVKDMNSNPVLDDALGSEDQKRFKEAKDGMTEGIATVREYITSIKEEINELKVGPTEVTNKSTAKSIISILEKQDLDKILRFTDETSKKIFDIITMSENFLKEIKEKGSKKLEDEGHKEKAKIFSGFISTISKFIGEFKSLANELFNFINKAIAKNRSVLMQLRNLEPKLN